MFISQDKKFAIILPPKTGTRSVQEVCKERGFDCINGRHGVDEAATRAVLDSRGIVAMPVRNIFDLLVSWWFHLNSVEESRPEFNSWLSKFLSKRQRYVKPGEPIFYGHPYANRIVRFENYAEDWGKVFQEAGYSTPVFSHIGKSEGRKHYHSYYNVDSVALVDKHFGEENRRYGYGF